MYLERVKYQTEENGEFKTGYYIAQFYNAEKSIILDMDYKVVEGDIWDYHSDCDSRLVFSVCEKEDFENIEEECNV